MKHASFREKGGHNRRGQKFLLALIGIFSVVSVVSTSVGLLPAVMRMSGPSKTYNCVDDTIQMYRFLTGHGINTRIIAGNLNDPHVPYLGINHVWLIAKLGPAEVAFDWGRPYLDNCHYAGYEITYVQLEQFEAAKKLANTTNRDAGT